MREPIGYFLLERGGDQGPLTDAQLKAPHVVGQTIRIPWSRIHTGPGRFEWGELDGRLAQCKRTNRYAQLLIQTGRDGYSPKWFGGQFITDDGQSAPAPWSPEMMNAWQELWGALGDKYAGNPLIVGTKITGPTWPSAEMHPCPTLKTKKGYSKAAMVEAWLSAGIAVVTAFPNVTASLAISVQSVADSYVRDVIGELNDNLRPGQLRIQHNALAAKTIATSDHHALVAECHKRGIGVGFEMVCTVKNVQRFGSRNIMDGIRIGKAAGGKWFDVYPQPEDIKGLR